MQYKLDKFTTTWDEAALETLNSEFLMMDLMEAQVITKSDGSSLLDYLVFDGGQTISLPEKTVEESTYFKAPWDSEV
jgi:hypothetical protein